MTTDELYARHVIPSYGRFPLTLARGAGTRVWDEDGRAYLDFTSGIAVNSLGHAHPAMQKALAAQSATLIHTSNLYLTRPQAELAARLDGLVGTHGKIFFSNSGAEANEGLYKLARKHGAPSGRHEIITLEGSFHGRTLAGIAATGQAKVKLGFEPPVAGFVNVPATLESVQAAVNDRTAAILVEPIQGEGGVRPLDAGFVRGLRALCDAHGMLLLYDEVQCGLGRTGDWCGWHATGAPEAVPDGISWAKGIGGGFPLGAFWARDRATAGGGSLADLLGPGTHATTYGGSPLACAVALAVLDTIEKESLLANTRERSAQLREAVTALASPVIRGIRGAGLLLGIEIADFRWRGQTGPDGKTPALRLTLKLLERGLLVVPAGETVIRLLPPLNVRAAECDEAVTILRDTLALAEPLS
ncbi:MAG: acetylornithine transaminase [Chthoniobacterales bacterium]|nr:acetylornithine transaminase [Chthoniobacterales bacterium]